MANDKYFFEDVARNFATNWRQKASVPSDCGHFDASWHPNIAIFARPRLATRLFYRWLFRSIDGGELPDKARVARLHGEIV
jgi:hypothetical protein